MRSSNPALSEKVFQGLSATDRRMTVDGTVNKTFVLFGLLLLSAAWSWSQFFPSSIEAQTGNPTFLPVLWGAAIGGFIVALVTIFKKEWAPVTAPIYVLLQGVVIGTLSSLFEFMYPGIVIDAVSLTFAVMLLMLALYRFQIIKVTEKFRTGVIAATGAVALVYIASMVLSLFGIQMPFLHDAGPIGIGISLVIVGIAALNLVLDFDFIAQGAERGAPHYMEWYGAFGLMVTLIWLYLEILRLLTKLRD